MPKLIINVDVPASPMVGSIRKGNVFKDRDGDLYLRTNEGAVRLFKNPGEMVCDEHHIESYVLKDYAPYTDLGPLTIGQ